MSCAFVLDVASLAPNESPSVDLLRHVRGCQVCAPALRLYQKQDRDIRFTYEALPVPARREAPSPKPVGPWAAMTLAAAVLLGAVIVGVGINQFRASQSPQRSLRAVAGEITRNVDQVGPFSATVSLLIPGSQLSGQDWTVVERVDYQDDSHWRRTILQDSLAPSRQSILTPGSYIAWDGQRLTIYSAIENIYYVRDDSPSLHQGPSAVSGLWDLSPLLHLAPFRASTVLAASPTISLGDYLQETCAARPDDNVSGRRTYHFSCRDAEIWFDQETGLTLRTINPTLPAQSPNPARPPQTIDREVTMVSYGASFSAATFTVSLPVGSNVVLQTDSTPVPLVPR